MDKTDPPQSFGVFKPVGHVVIALRSPADVEAMLLSLGQRGFSRPDWVCYSPAEMKAQVDAELQTASPLAAIGQDLNLVKAHRALAEEGCSFLVVHTPHSEQVESVAQVANTLKAVAAQHYGRFIVEELIDLPPGHKQVFESPDRGLDAVSADEAN